MQVDTLVAICGFFAALAGFELIKLLPMYITVGLIAFLVKEVSVLYEDDGEITHKSVKVLADCRAKCSRCETNLNILAINTNTTKCVYRKIYIKLCGNEIGAAHSQRDVSSLKLSTSFMCINHANDIILRDRPILSRSGESDISALLRVSVLYFGIDRMCLLREILIQHGLRDLCKHIFNAAGTSYISQ